MKDITNSNVIVETIIAIIAFMVGYPYLGNFFIIAMTPLALVMVFSKDSRFLPALLLHCASDTSIMYVIFFAIIITCVINSNLLKANKQTKLLYILLLATMPIYILLVFQRIVYDGSTWQGALGYSCFYLSFWAFLYGFIIAGTFARSVLKNIIIVLAVTYLYTFLFNHYSRVVSTLVYIGTIYGLYLAFSKRKTFEGLAVSLVSIVLFFSSGVTFTELLSLMYAVVLFFMISINRLTIAQKSAGWIPYAAIALLMIYGMSNYQIALYGEPTETIDFSSWENLKNRASFKLFGDRALFWAAGWEQLISLKPILPIHNIPDIIAYRADGSSTDELSFGAHNTPLQLLRIFGFFMGGVLILCYYKCTVLASKLFISEIAEKWFLPLVIVSLTSSIVLFLTGTAAMLCNFALFSFGIMGIAFNKSQLS